MSSGPASPDAPESRARLGQSLRAIGWATLGIRRNTGHSEETAGVRPLHLIAFAFATVLLFVLALIAVVHWVAD